MTAPEYQAIALVITAAGTVITAVGTVIVGIMGSNRGKVQQAQGEVIKQVERQGNAVSVEVKRTNMVYSKRLADVTKDPGDVAVAHDAKQVYEEAVKNLNG